VKILLWGSLIFSFSFILHLALWRVRLPLRQTRALLGIFFLTPAVSLPALWYAGRLAGSERCCLPLLLPEYFHISLFCVSLTLAYVITYSAFEADSPSLLMVLAIAGAGQEGLEEGRFSELMTEEVLVKPRLRDLLRDGLAYVEGEKYRLTPKGRAFIRIFIFHRKLLNAPLSGG
jgi:hypothetical protein